MLNFVFTIDGDWKEYFDVSLPEEKRRPDKAELLRLIGREIRLAEVLGGRFIHFVHSSPRARDFFLQPDFVALWKKIEAAGGSVGVHCHEDDPRRDFFAGDKERMRSAITLFSNGLRAGGLHPVAYRGGYLAFNQSLIPILEENKLFLDFSCEPGRHIPGAADWRGAPENYYRMDDADHRREGQSDVFEVPLGEGMYIELTPLWKTWLSAEKLKRKAEKSGKPVVVPVLAHTYDFSSFWMRLKIKIALSILKRYGRFINADEVYALVKKDE